MKTDARFWTFHTTEGGQPFPSGSYAIVDENEGGIVAYANSEARALVIVRALEAGN